MPLGMGLSSPPRPTTASKLLASIVRSFSTRRMMSLRKLFCSTMRAKGATSSEVWLMLSEKTSRSSS